MSILPVSIFAGATAGDAPSVLAECAICVRLHAFGAVADEAG